MKTKTLALSAIVAVALGGAGIHSLLPSSHSSRSAASASGQDGENGGTTNATKKKTARFDRASGPGLRHTYATRFEQDIALTGGDGRSAKDGAKVRLRVTGNLDLAFVAYDGAKHRLFAQLADVHVAIGDAAARPSPETQAVERELTKPFYVQAETDGRVRGYSFARDLSPTARNILRGVLGSAQVAVRDEAQWAADEDDIQGSYVASYSKDEAGAIVKTKRPYSKIEGMATLDVRARGVASVAEDGWPTNVTLEEHKVASMGEKMPVATTDARLALTLTGTKADPSLLGRFEREQDDLVQASAFGTMDDAESARVADGRLASDATSDAILGEARAATDDQAMIAAGDRLAARLRLNPNEADRMATLARTLPAREANLVVGALGGAATPESTKALGRLLSETKGPPAVRANAATQLAFAKGANATEARDSLSQGLSDPSREVRDSSALALGNVARELGDADPETVKDLVARYERARDDEERVTLLEALGNSGSAEILPVVRAALASENESLREAAAHALRFLPLGDADKVLADVLGTEPSPTVIVAAIDSIGYRVVEMHARALERAVLADSAGRVRAAVAEIVQKALAGRKATLGADARAVLAALLDKARASTTGRERVR